LRKVTGLTKKQFRVSATKLGPLSAQLAYLLLALCYCFVLIPLNYWLSTIVGF